MALFHCNLYSTSVMRKKQRGYPRTMLMESGVPSSLGKLSCESWSIFDQLCLKLSHVMHAIFNVIFYVYLTLSPLVTLFFSQNQFGTLDVV